MRKIDVAKMQEKIGVDATILAVGICISEDLNYHPEFCKILHELACEKSFYEPPDFVEALKNAKEDSVEAVEVANTLLSCFLEENPELTY